MGVWILMLMCSLAFPAIMLIAGKLFMKGMPNKINWWIGYRTPMSTKNEDTWRFAHTVAGKFWWKWGWPCLALSVIGMLCVLGQPENTVALIGLCIMCVMTIPIFGVLLHTEKALHKAFDKDGNRR